ncbi:unnamed protein product [Notodromas monacha]|uniref:C2H2-type domain-containing protein n=1 Tax=Notodromas monacha TaxID=399045 RepID=A0A7R9GD43_9CRUS|nr:unnamed protein product [Notodromas monacha]CAG0916590.1 unnamed protein product [Notodromas monacha]
MELRDLEDVTKKFGVFLGKLEDVGIVRTYRVEVWFNTLPDGSPLFAKPDFRFAIQNLVGSIDSCTAAIVIPTVEAELLERQEVTTLECDVPEQQSLLPEEPVSNIPLKSEPQLMDEISAKPAARKILKKRLGSFSKDAKFKRRLKKKLQPKTEPNSDGSSSAFTCSHCGMNFSLLVLYNAHLRTEHKNVTKLVPGAKCDKCGQKFLSVRALENHCDSVHGTDDLDGQAAGTSGHCVQKNDEEPAVEDAAEKHSSEEENSIPAKGACVVKEEIVEVDVQAQTLVEIEDSSSEKQERRNDEALVETHEEPPPTFPCSFCNTSFIDLRSVDEHEQRCAISSSGLKKQPFFSCLSCNFAFSAINAFRVHQCAVAEFKKKDGLPVLIADKDLFDENALKLLPKCIYGWNIGLMDGKKKFFCSLCYEECRSYTRMAYHLSKCKGGPFKCELCPVQRDFRPELDLHKARAHKKELAFFCDECSATYARKSSLLKHKLAHHERSVRVFSCPTCGVGFEKYSFLIKHREEVHKEKILFDCDICKKSFGTKGAVRLHKKTVHKTDHVQEFACKSCDKVFRRKDYLLNHMKSHSGKSLFTCATCGRQYTKKEKLCEHMNKHSSGATILCEVCGLEFMLRKDLVAHIKEAHRDVKVSVKSWKYALPELSDGNEAGDLLSTAVALADISDRLRT